MEWMVIHKHGLRNMISTIDKQYFELYLVGSNISVRQTNTRKHSYYCE